MNDIFETNEIFEALEKVAGVLEPVPNTVVFTGGITISLYLDECPPDIRPTKDVDCVVEVTSKTQYYKLVNLLRDLGLQESTDSKAPLCRWQYENIQIDIMPCTSEILGFSNRWYAPGIASSVFYPLPSGRQIRIFSAPYLLASKIEAFIGRGIGMYWSNDIEDILSLLEGRSCLEEEVESADSEVKIFLAEWFSAQGENLRDRGLSSFLIQRISRLALAANIRP